MIFAAHCAVSRQRSMACTTAVAAALLCVSMANAQEAASGTPSVANTRARLLNINDCKPPYPRESLRAEEAGRTRLRIHVAASGELRGVSLIQSSGFARLDDAMIAAIGRCKFAAATQAGVAIDASFTLDYNWRIEGPPPAIANQCKPEYPVESIRAEEQGKTTLRFEVDADGGAKKIEIAQSSGFVRLDEASIATLRRCRFRLPPAAASAPAPRAQVEFIWRLEDGVPAALLGPEARDPYRPPL
jgi:TonB family protein